MYLRVVKVRDDGIVVNGAKIRIAQGPVANEIIALPYGPWSRATGITQLLLPCLQMRRALNSLLDTCLI